MLSSADSWYTTGFASSGPTTTPSRTIWSQFRAVWRLDSLIGDVNALGVHQATATVMRSGPFRRSVVIGAVVTFHPCGWFQAAASGRTFLGEIEPRRSDDSGQVLNPAPRTIRLFCNCEAGVVYARRRSV